ncbi:hypothetical protein [Calothrix sp. NIES-2100]|uniref:hypothetical protein n=1 Tax=Calothrix sp. NIES-2100 TaxID=1954172 RepID=UPI0030DBD2A7
MSHFLSHNFLSLSAINPPTLIPAPIVIIQPLPIISPINPPAPVIPQNYFRFMV